MRGLPLLIPILLMAFVSVGLGRVKTVVVVGFFGILFILGYKIGFQRFGNPKTRIEVREQPFLYALLLSFLIILFQIVFITRSVPLLNPSVRTHLNPKLTMLTYLLGLPSSTYLTIKGKKLGYLYIPLVSLYAYRTPVLVSAIAITLAYLEGKKVRGAILAGVVGAFAIIGLSVLRGGMDILIRIEGTTSVLDVIIKQASLAGFYKGHLQWAGVTSYIVGGIGPRGMIARYLGIYHVTITATLVGGMYLDFGLFAGIEMLLLGLYYGITEKLISPISRALYYVTLAYGLVGVETGILDLPTYLMFLITIILAWREFNGNVREAIRRIWARIYNIISYR
ncbi:hypothetical protein A3L04_01185 [Thermococcus chitonophagus]|uniref:Molybdenum ABC transporter, periplasmic molybdenum-binding protein ModA (TC 3.A.1.8.1) n=1 Tax=Thermococcus chitonophagus TaxID=54262 RepID=A0A160VQM7_9EURY|nr:hypothetical protein [Thermococcus chitonophagus]ASJ15781.1 hypothetical protein A3L04_01185 [Thermococcus chitonophagus]CUX77010.1 Molybdenum ABC transporter, periplasmic molybdenum-binding protein ModA (TC 3.A.1.8.1) [Thermococcus chitonophagus]